MYSFSKEEVLENQPRQGRKTRKNRNRGGFNKKIAVAVGMAAVIVCSGFWLYKASAAYAIVVNGKQVAVVEERADGEKAVQDFIAATSKKVGVPVTLQDKIEIKEVQVDKKDMVLGGNVAKILSQTLVATAPGAVIVINGQEKAALSSKTAAENLLTKIKNRYSSSKSGGDVKVLKTEIAEKVAVVAKDIPVNDLIDDHQAWQLLTVGTDKMVIHEVKDGESMWTISQANHMSNEELIAANPGIDPDDLSIGDKIKLIKAEPLLHVTSTIECTEVQAVPYETQVTYDKTMLRNKEEVKQAGKDGSKEFQYKVVAVNGQTVDKQFIAAKVLTKAVPKLVKKGSKLVLASRSSGGGGSGQLMWPARGGISSRFGYRHGDFHTGMDIDGSTGDSIRAAEGGTVIDAGWAGSYGNLIKIDHGSGVQTWYAHLSRITCSVGDRVDQGETIGREGSTGNSTGSHLHFEVRINGSPVNPAKYLN